MEGFFGIWEGVGSLVVILWHIGWFSMDRPLGVPVANSCLHSNGLPML
jgi:hypothetical protein